MKIYNLNNLKLTNLVIKFTTDQSQNKKIISFIFPISRTEKIQFTRNSETGNLFKKKTIITNLNKKIIFKEGKFFKVFIKLLLI